jgi:hypothetical protein
MRDHLGFRIPSPAIMDKIGTRFRADVKTFATGHDIPVVRFSKGDRKIDVMRPYVAALENDCRSGVAAIGVAQEYQNVFAANAKQSPNGMPWFTFTKADRRVTCYYFYLFDEQFGPSFIKVCTYFPYPVKVWLNGHEWAKRQCARAGIGYTALSNGFAGCDDPAGLQAICDRLGPADIQAFFDRWTDVLPLPLTEHDQTDGYWWELSMRQIETSRTAVFTAPRHARAFFETLVADNLDVGRPEQVEIIFGRRIPRKRGKPSSNRFHTRVVTSDTGVTVNACYKNSRIKQYLKDGRALRIETVINAPTDLGIKRRLEHLDELQAAARDINTRLIDNQRVGQGCVLASPAFERAAQSTLTEDGRRSPALRFGDPRVMALLGALAATINAVYFTHRSLRARVSSLLGVMCTANQISYDLSRLRLGGLIERIDGTNTYRTTPEGQRIAIFYTKVYHRLLRPLTAADKPPAEPELRHALTVIDHHVADYCDTARLSKAA